MADFCTKCAIEMWGTELPPDIDIKEISESLKPGTYKPVICEGCGMRAFGKTETGDIEIAMPVEDAENTDIDTTVNWVPLAVWEEKYEFMKA